MGLQITRGANRRQELQAIAPFRIRPSCNVIPVQLDPEMPPPEDHRDFEDEEPAAISLICVRPSSVSDELRTLIPVERQGTSAKPPQLVNRCGDCASVEAHAAHIAAINNRFRTTRAGDAASGMTHEPANPVASSSSSVSESSMTHGQKFCGLRTGDAFWTTVIFMILLPFW
jgi:hypothetical protein